MHSSQLHCSVIGVNKQRNLCCYEAFEYSLLIAMLTWQSLFIIKPLYLAWGVNSAQMKFLLIITSLFIVGISLRLFLDY